MSYRLINANDLNGVISDADYEKVLNMPCVFADLPNGMDGKHYDLQSNSDEDCITLRLEKGTLKYSDKDYVVYKKEWLKKWWQPELALLGIELPSIQPKPNTDVLDKIRAEIETLEDGISSYHNDRPWIYKDEVLAIIDKYTAEKEQE